MELNKILERGLKLACLIPTQCTGKGSCSYCTSPTNLPLRGPCPGCQLPSHTPYLPAQLREAQHSLTCTSFPFILITNVEKRQGERRKQNKSQSSWDFLGRYLTIFVWARPPWLTETEGARLFLAVCWLLLSNSRVFDNHFRMKCCVNAMFIRT